MTRGFSPVPLEKFARARSFGKHLRSMAKDEARNIARIYFVEQGLNRKVIAEKLGVREKTVGDWAAKGNWEDLRTAHLTSSKNVENALRGLIQTYTEQLTQMEQDRDLALAMGGAKEKARLVDALVKTSKTLEVVRAENDITLSARLRIMEWVFGELQKYDPAAHVKLVEFQSLLLDEAARIHA